MPTKTGKPIRMIKGSGANARTHYSCGVIERARATGVNILIARQDEDGEMIEVEVPPKMVHRPGFTESYGEAHELAGVGKYVAALSANGKRVTGAQHVNPYLHDSLSNATIVEVLKQNIGPGKLRGLRARVAQNSESGVHLLWEGKRNADGFLPGAESDWLTADEIWDLAREANPALLKTLQSSKSGRRGVTSHKSAKEKFITNLNVLRRATCVVDVSTGEREWRGGATPYSKPLEQSGFAIDMRFLTYGVDKNGDDLAEYFYRMVIGRLEPHILRKTEWSYEGSKSTIAFKNDRARQEVQRAA